MMLKKLILLLAVASARPQRPCPQSCNCNMDTMSCPDLIDSCPQCHHWPTIEFNQISNLGPFAFKNFTFSPHRHYSLVIYKLLNSSLAANTFNQLAIHPHSNFQITFQYNSFIEFKADSLSGLHIYQNSTLTFNFPYTTQVLVSLACLNGLKFVHQSRLIFKIFKSFSVSFLASKMVRLENGQVLFDINSTQLVKFERQSLHTAIVNSSLSFHLKSIEKCIVKKNFFLNSNLSRSKILFHLKQIIFLDMSAGSIKNLKLTASSLKIYLVELISSFCVQPNTLSELSLQANSSLNFSVLQSKNVQFMSNSVSRIDSQHSSLFIGVFDADLNDHDVNTLLNKHHHSFEFYNQYYFTKQKYTYNLSVARNAFTLLSAEKLVIVADYLDTAYFDEFFVSGPERVNILLNVKNVVIGEQSVADSELEFGSEPRVVKLAAGFVPKTRGLGQTMYAHENQSFAKQWENCIEENVDFLSNGEVTDVLSYAEADANLTSVMSKSNVKITGLFIIGLVLLILFLILVVNLVQYKYREDSFEEFESSIQTGNGGENLIKCENVEPEDKESQCMIKATGCLDDTQMND